MDTLVTRWLLRLVNSNKVGSEKILNYLNEKFLQRLKNLERDQRIEQREQSDGVDGDSFNLTMVYWQCWCENCNSKGRTTIGRILFRMRYAVNVARANDFYLLFCIRREDRASGKLVSSLLYKNGFASFHSCVSFLFFFYLRQSSSLLNYIYICIIPLSLFLRIFRKRNSFRDEEILPS